MRAKSLHSPLWHRVEALKPKLRDDVDIVRQVVRGQVWYVVRDRLSARAHRFSPAVYFVLARMDGARTFDTIWRDAITRFGEDAPSQDQILQTASQLYVAHLLRSDAGVDESDLASRGRMQGDALWSQNLKNPMFLRFPLFDPDRFLNATVHLIRPLCNWLGGALWLLGVGWLAVQMVVHWSDLTADLADKVLARENLLTILLIFPVLKILHEFGHAYATKLAGEDVHEMGVMLLTMLPAPYVDASSSAMIASKWRRGLVAAAGIIVELAVAAVAMLVWREAQPGLTRSLAYDGLLTASISTLIFNGNPLLRFDAYYVLSDLLEIPNLASRAQRYYLYLLQRYLFGASDAQDPSFAQGERFWFIAYTPLSFAYRMFTLSGIAMFVATRYYAVGVALACWLVVSSVLWPLLKGLKFVLISPNLAGNRARAASVVALGAITVASIVGLVPISNATVARGIVWIPENSRIVAQSSGRLQEFLVDPGANVAIGDPIARLDDPYIAAKHGKAEARLAEIDARLFAAQALNPFDAQVLNRQRDLARQELAEIERQQQNLVVRSPAAGVLIVPHADDMVDGFVKHGQTLGYVMAKRAPVIRASVPEDEIEYFPERTRAVAVRFAESPWTELDSVTINRQVPKSSRRLPSPALATVNGGPFELDPAAKDKNSILDSIFEIDIATSNAFAVERWGQRVWVRFDHGAAPLSERLYRAFRQLFLGRFHV